MYKIFSVAKKSFRTEKINRSGNYYSDFLTIKSEDYMSEMNFSENFKISVKSPEIAKKLLVLNALMTRHGANPPVKINGTDEMMTSVEILNSELEMKFQAVVEQAVKSESDRFISTLETAIKDGKIAVYYDECVQSFKSLSPESQTAVISYKRDLLDRESAALQALQAMRTVPDKPAKK